LTDVHDYPPLLLEVSRLARYVSLEVARFLADCRVTGLA
jgi:hypothetical protein